MGTDRNKAKRRSLRNRRWILCHGAPATLILLAPTWAASAEQAGTVQDIKGEAFAEAAAGRRALDRAAAILVGDEVSTERQSRLSMRLGVDTDIKLGEQARLKIDRFLINAGGTMTLESGPLLFDRPAGAAPAAVQIRSPFALIAVRGTRFFAGPSNGRFGVFVARGLVTITAAQRRVVLRDGEGTDIAFPGARPSPVRRWLPPRIQAALDSVS